MAFVLHVPIVMSCLVECVFTYFNKVCSLKEHEAVFLKRENFIFSIHIMHCDINPPQKHHLPLFHQPYLKSANCPSPPPFLGNSPYILVICDPIKKLDFSVNPHNIKIFHP